MDLKELQTAGIDPGSHWYYRTKRLPLLAYFDEAARDGGTVNLVDVGAGSGFFTRSLLEHGGGRIGTALQVDTGYPAEPGQAASRPARSRDLPESIHGSLVLMMDVLEHVEDDGGLLRSVRSRCRGRNRFFITAPAFQWLWSPHDRFLGHVRRYTLGGLRRAVAEAGIRVDSSYYYYGLLLPPVWLLRRLKSMGSGGVAAASDLRPAGRLASWLLEGLCRLELPFRRWNRAGGVTCVVEGSVE